MLLCVNILWFEIHAFYTCTVPETISATTCITPKKKQRDDSLQGDLLSSSYEMCALR